jgi:hypothetical protein
MKKTTLISAAILLAFIITTSGCFTSGAMVSTNSTMVQLSQPNFKVIATNVTGQAKADYLFGASIGIGMYAQTYALIPLQKDRALYKKAIEELWKKFESTYGKSEGRRLALVNLRYDTEALNVFFYTSPRLTVIADVVEFQ